MKQGGVNFRKVLGTLLLLIAGVFVAHMIITINVNKDLIDNQKASLKEEHSIFNNKIIQLGVLVTNASDAENKHILSSTKKEKESYTQEITKTQNEFLDIVYDLENKLDEKTKEHLYEAKENFAFYATNNLKVQDLSYKGKGKQAWELSKNESLSYLKKILSNIDLMKESLAESYISQNDELDLQLELIESSIKIRLYIASSIVLLAFGFFISSYWSKKKTSPDQSIEKHDRRKQSTESGVKPANLNKNTEQLSSRVGSQPSKSNDPIRRFYEQTPPIPTETKKPILNLGQKIEQRSEDKLKIHNILDEAAQISGQSVSEGSIQNDFGSMYNNSSQVITMLQSVSEMTCSSITEAQDIAIKVARVGEFEVRKIASGALKISRDIQELMLFNYNRMLDSIRKAEKVEQELQGMIGNVNQVSQILEQAKGTEEIINNLDQYLQETPDMTNGLQSQLAQSQPAKAQTPEPTPQPEEKPESETPNDLDPESENDSVKKEFDELSSAPEDVEENLVAEEPIPEGTEPEEEENTVNDDVIESDEEMIQELSDSEIEAALQNTVLDEDDQLNETEGNKNSSSDLTDETTEQMDDEITPEIKETAKDSKKDNIVESAI